MPDQDAAPGRPTDREAILASKASVRLVQGPPGSGKTFFGCQLADYALRADEALRPARTKILFLTFARNAVAQIRAAYAKLSGSETANADAPTSKRIRVETFSAFCWWLASGYARYLPEHGPEQPWLLGSDEVGGEPIPAGHRGYTFQQLHCTARAILEIPAIRGLISDLYPLVIVDEHQDVDPLLQSVLSLLCERSRAVILRGPGQSVYGSLKSFAPDDVLDQVIADLKPEVFTLRPLGPGRNRYCAELAAFLASYDSSGKLSYAAPHSVLRLVPRINSRGNPNSLETFVGLAVQEMRRELRAYLGRPSSVCVLASTNSAAASAHTKLTRGSETYKLDPANASLLFKDEILMLYGRLLFTLLNDHWSARARSSIPIDIAAVGLKALSRSAMGKVSGSDPEYARLARYIADKVSRLKRPKRGQSAMEKLASDLARLAEFLRVTKAKLPSGTAPTPFSRHDTCLLRHLASELLGVVEPELAGRASIDVANATSRFERSIRQRVLLEKTGTGSLLQVMTIHKAKGREFDGTVLLVEDDPRALWRAESFIHDEEQEDLYRVAVSRSRERIVIVAFEDAVADAASPVSRLLTP